MTETTENYNEVFTQLSYATTAAVRAGRIYTYKNVEYDVADRTERIALVDAVTADYIEAHAEYSQRGITSWIDSGSDSERPPSIPVNSALLERLADALLYEELTDKHPDKMTNTEYPFMSEWQFDLRRGKETVLEVAEQYGDDGVNYAKPVKRRRTHAEQSFIDNAARWRNRARSARYKRDVSPGEVVRYNIADGDGFTPTFVACRGLGQRWADELSSVYAVRG